MTLLVRCDEMVCGFAFEVDTHDVVFGGIVATVSQNKVAVGLASQDFCTSCDGKGSGVDQ